MRTKKSWYLAWVLVFAVLFCFSCAKQETPVEEEETIQKSEIELYDETVAEIMKLMKEKGTVNNVYKKKRSLAKHIIRDHVLLRVYFQNQQFYEMAETMGDGISINGTAMKKDQIREFWKNEYGSIRSKLTDDQKSRFDFDIEIELVFYAKEITLWDPADPQTGRMIIDGVEREVTIDGKATEKFEFKILVRDKGEIVLDPPGEGDWDRDHSSECPWGPPPPTPQPQPR
jgi:hypothetical protein